MHRMRAIRCLSHGHPARLEIAEVRRPEMIAGGVRVRIEYCGIGFPELLMLEGKYQVRLELPFIPGSEISGVVTEVADGVTYPRVGARVAGLDQKMMGGLAEEVVCDASHLVELPEFVPTRVAAGMVLNYATACYGLVQRASLQVGETALVLGASGNLGTAFIEMLDVLGARPLAACSSERKLETACAHGAADGFNYTEEPIKEAVARITHDSALDMVIDPVGGEFTEAAFRCLKPGGRLLVVGFASGDIPCLQLNLPLLKNCAVVGAFLKTQVVQSPGQFRENLEAVFELYREGALQPDLVEVDCFEDFSCGFSLLTERDRIGKVVMRISQPS